MVQRPSIVPAWSALFAVVLLLASVSSAQQVPAARAQSSLPGTSLTITANRAQTEPSPGAGPLKIGYLPEGSDLRPARQILDDLRVALLENPSCILEMERAGYADISLRPCDSTVDMTQRLRAGEFEIAFATAMVYIRLLESERPAGAGAEALYDPSLQFRARGDTQTADGVMRRAAVFVGPRSPLWNERNPQPSQIRAEIASHGLAVSNSDSLASYYYPQIALRRRYGELRPGRLIFCGSSEEVFKHVVSGLARIGACELNALSEPNAPAGLTHTLFLTEPTIPTDPILTRVDLLPAGRHANLGAALRSALRSFFNDSQQSEYGVAVESSSSRAFDLAIRAIDFFEQGASGQGGDARSAGASSELPSISYGRTRLPADTISLGESPSDGNADSARPALPEPDSLIGSSFVPLQLPDSILLPEDAP